MATRNRAAYIDETLTCLLNQAEPEVEIVIVDGASTDGTDRVVERYAASDGRIRLIRLAANGGVDQDYDRAVQEATGIYAWLMTDDDLLAPGAIARVLAACRREPQLVVIDAAVYGPECKIALEAKRLSFTGERIYAAGDPKLLADLGDHLTFIGAVIIRRDVWLARERQRFYGSLFIHVGVIFQEPIPGVVIAIGDPLIHIRYGLGGWVPRRFEVWMFLWPQLIWSFTAYPEWARAAVCPKEPWRVVKRLIAFRAKGAYGLAEYRKFILPRASGLMRALALMVALVPGTLLNMLGILSAWVRGHSGHSGMLDLRASPYYWRRWSRFFSRR